MRMKNFVTKDKTVLVTGASSGIGNAIATYLAKQAYQVLATVRKETDVVKLNQLGCDNLKPVCPLDFTNQIQITSVAQSIIVQRSKFMFRVPRNLQIIPLVSFQNSDEYMKTNLSGVQS